MPTETVAQTLQEEHERWLAGKKRGGGARSPTAMRHVYIDDRNDGTPGRGFARRWAGYRNAWQQLG